VEKNQLIDAPKLLVFVGFIDIYKWLIDFDQKENDPGYANWGSGVFYGCHNVQKM